MAIIFANEPVNQTRGSGIHLLTNNDIDSSGVSSIVMGGIPDTAVKIYIYFCQYSTDGNVSGRFRLRVGSGAGNNIDSGNNYWWNSFQREGNNAGTNSVTSASSYMNCLDQNHTSSGHSDTGFVTLTRMTHPSSTGTNGGWMMECIAGDTTRNLSYVASGRWASNMPINTVQIFNSGYGYDDSARMSLLYEIGDYS